MAEVLVVADDLTGANATGARFARLGMRVGTVAPEHAPPAMDDYDVVVANLDSRQLPPAHAADRISDLIGAVWPVGLVVKRTDTTLRGNIGAELEAAWRAVRARTPDRVPVRALFVPAFPGSARVTADGQQLLDGLPLERTELALDPLNPMTTSDVAEIVAQQSALGLRHVPLRRITRNVLAEDLRAGDEPVVLCDALTDRHLADIAAAAAEAHRRDGTVWVSVDPGPFGALLAEALRPRGPGDGSDDGSGGHGPLLAVVGSATALTRRQLDTAAREERVRFVDVDAARLCDEPGHRAEVARGLASALAQARFPEVVVARTTTSATDVAELPARARRTLPRLLATAVAEALRTPVGPLGPPLPAPAQPTGLYTSGGEITSAVLEALDVRVFEVHGEVLPLAVHGRLGGGPLDGIPVVTKGGLVGDDSALTVCLEQLRRSARERFGRVRTRVAGQPAPTKERGIR